MARDPDVLKPIFERMRAQGFDLLERNAVLAEELCRALIEINRIERELGKAAKAIQSIAALVMRYKERLRELCDSSSVSRISTVPEPENGMPAAPKYQLEGRGR
jgi:hypothetical protein